MTSVIPGAPQPHIPLFTYKLETFRNQLGVLHVHPSDAATGVHIKVEVLGDPGLDIKLAWCFG